MGKSRDVAQKAIYAALKILKENDGEMPGSEVIEEIRKRVSFDEWESGRYEKTGRVRWESILHFHTIDCIKAGYLLKKNGIWYLTPEGEKAIESGPEKLTTNAIEAYRKWKEENLPSISSDDHDISLDTDKEQEANIDDLEAKAFDGIKDFINKLNPYEFQDLVASLLRSMGYYTPFVAPRGKDGGIDIVAYGDPLGAKSPRIKVQVKHRPDSKSNPGEIRELIGLLRKDGDVGLFVSTGGFTTDSKIAARESHMHIELIDMDKFIELYLENYHKMNDEDRKCLPLKAIYFVG